MSDSPDDPNNANSGNSGNRWEPEASPTQPTPDQPPPEQPEQPEQPDAVATQQMAATAPRRSLRDRVREAPKGATVAAGSAAAIVALAVAGVGGYAVGRTTSDDDRGPASFGPGGQRDGDRDGGREDFRGGGIPDGAPGGVPGGAPAPPAPDDDDDAPAPDDDGAGDPAWYVVPQPAPGTTAA